MPRLPGALWDEQAAFQAEAALPELIEAAIRAGQREVAAAAYKTLSERALAATPWALGLRTRCEALLDEGEHAEGRVPGIPPPAGPSRVVVDLARTHLLYGQWLRRAKRRRDARTHARSCYRAGHVRRDGHGPVR